MDKYYIQYITMRMYNFTYVYVCWKGVDDMYTLRQ